MLGKAVSAAPFTWFFVTIAFVVGTICSEYTRGIVSAWPALISRPEAARCFLGPEWD